MAGTSGSSNTPQPKTSTARETLRQVGLTVRGAVQGVADLADIVTTPLWTMPLRAIGLPVESTSDLARRVMTQVGLPLPQAGMETTVQSAVGLIAAAPTALAGAARVSSKAAVTFNEALAATANVGVRTSTALTPSGIANSGREFASTVVAQAAQAAGGATPSAARVAVTGAKIAGQRVMQSTLVQAAPLVASVADFTATQDKLAEAQRGAPTDKQVLYADYDIYAAYLKEVSDRTASIQAESLATSTGIWAGVALLGRFSPSGALLTASRYTAGMSALTAGASVASHTIAEQEARYELQTGSMLPTVGDALAPAAAFAVAATLSTQAGRSWAGAQFASLKADGWWTGAGRVLGAGFVVSELLNIAVNHDQEVALQYVGQLAEREREAALAAVPAPGATATVAQAAPEVTTQTAPPASLRTDFTQQATRSPPSVRVSARPTAPRVGEGQGVTVHTHTVANEPESISLTELQAMYGEGINASESENPSESMALNTHANRPKLC